MGGSTIRARRWTRREYGRLIDLGVLHEDEAIELLEGCLIVAEPQHTPHATAIDLAGEALQRAFGPGWRIRIQLPLGLGADSEPEPDIAVVRGDARDFLAAHPATAALVVEVADASLRLDRRVKARIYARAGITDYWIVNLLDRVLEVHRDPVSAGRRGSRYRDVRVMPADARVVPLAMPFASIAVADLLP
ncbi:MAG: Uma2 family endonuclease [Candidatus Rokuibacteriota bacterium]